MTDLVPKVSDGRDARANTDSADSRLSRAAASDAAWLRGNLRSPGTSLANDDKFAEYSDGSGRHLCAVPERVDLNEEDWNILFGAVKQKLQSTVNQPMAGASPSQALEQASAMRAVVLDCLRALDTLFKALEQERANYRPLGE